MKTDSRILYSCLFVAAAAGFPASIRASEKSPNFVIFYEDDLGWADTSVSMMDGEPLAKSDFYQTPQLERLAKRGVRFSNGYCPTPTCTGSRISIQFGKTSARMQYRNVFDVLAHKQRPDGWDDEISMAAVVKAAGQNYITAHFGKGMGVRRMDSADYDVSDEFDKGPNGNAQGQLIDVVNRIPIPDDNPKRIVELTKRSVDFVREHAGKRPFYLMVSHYAVHIPHQASPPAIERCRQRWIDMGRSAGDKSMDTECRYAAMIEETDASLGALMDELEDAGELNNTYIVFTSDNGGGHGRRDANKNRFNGPLQEGKRSTFEGGLRVPFVVAGPGIQPGSQCDVPVAQWDLLPTLHDLSGSQEALSTGVDGGSLRDVFERGNGGAVTRGAPGLIFHYTCHYHPPISVIRIGDYKLMRHLNSGEMKLFDVAQDYKEEHDLAATMPEKVAEMDHIRQQYIDTVDGGRMEDVYAAYIGFLDDSEQKAELSVQKKIEALEKANPPDIDVQKASLQKELEKKKREFAAKRGINAVQMASDSWRESSKQEAVESIGVDKKGNVIIPKAPKPIKGIEKKKKESK